MKEQWREIVLIVFVIALSIFLFSQNAETVSENIIVTEICPSGCAATDHQWVEIYNKSTQPVDLVGWKFWEGSINHGLAISPSSTVTSTILQPYSYAIIAQNDVVFFADHPEVTSTVFDSAWTTLNKTGEEIGIKKGSGTGDFIEKFVYTSINNFSLERVKFDGDPSETLEWKEHSTGSSPGKQNYWWQEGLIIINHIPIAHIEAPAEAELDEEVVFDASESSDPEGLITKYEWTIENMQYAGVNVTYTFTTTGTKQVFLTVFDNDGASSTVSHLINIISPDEPPQDENVASTSAVEIFINEFMSDPNSGEREWIELFNTSDVEVSLEGYTLYDGVGKIATVTETIASSEFKTVYLSSSKLNQSGDLIVLKNPFGFVVDTVAYGDWDGGNITDNAPTPGKGFSVARVSDGEQTDNNRNDFAYTITPTPNSPNNITTKEAPQTSSNSSGGSSVVTIQQPSPQSFIECSITINEFVSVPGDGENEFVELYNTTNNLISLEGWVVQDGSLVKTPLTGLIGSHDFFVIEKPKGSLNNTGDLITLSDPSGKEIDRVVYGSWNGEDTAALVPPKGSSLIRVNYADTSNDEKDFFITETITKGKANILTQKEMVTQKSSTTTMTSRLGLGSTAPSGTIFITEIFPNPTGADNEKEFIEIFNTGSSVIDLSGWKIGDSTKKYTIEDIEIKPQSFYIFYRTETGISLNNSGEETVSLWDGVEVLFDSVTYSGTVANDSSYSKFGSDWAWVSSSTAGLENKHASENGGDTNISIIESSITLYSPDLLPLVVEILPNPVGADTKNEYIELFNPFDIEISLTGLLLDDDEGGSKPFTFPEGTILPAKSYQAWYSKDTKLSLNNSSDVVRLLDSDEEIVLSETEYTSAKEGKSYTFGNNVWFWTPELTPDKKNPTTPSIATTAVKKKTTSTVTKPAISTTLEQARNYDVGTVVKLAGIVSTEPGLLSSQYMYVAGSNGSGIQIYSSKKDFPPLARGDKVEIAGELSEVSGEERVKTQTAADIRIVGKETEIVPLPAEVSNIGEVYEGGLLEIKGEVTGIKGSYVYLDDGTDEIRVYIRSGSGIDKSIFKEGIQVAITGIVQETKSGYLVSPRDMKDVRIEEGSIKGEKISSAKSKSGGPHSKREILFALFLTLAGVAVVLGIKLYGNKIKEFFKKKNEE